MAESLTQTAPAPPAATPTAAMEAANGILPLRLEGVSYTVDGQTLVSGVSCTLAAGVRTIVMGPNGAGKSLLLRLCHGLIPPTAGSVRWQGPAAAEAGRRQAMVFQRPVVLRRSALANVAYALGLRDVPGRERRRQALEALERAGLAALARRPARVLSAGEQQRLALARAWAIKPEVLFLDEPTASLDPAATRSVEQIIAAIHATGTKIVMTTHDLGQARRLADEVLFLHHGRLREHAPAERFFTEPDSAEAQAFLRGELLW